MLTRRLYNINVRNWNMKKYIKSALGGKEKLWKVFWIQNILGVIILSIISSFVYILCFLKPAVMLSNNPITTIAVVKNVPLLILGFLFTGFLLWYEIVAIISLWKCSWNSGNRFWGYAARGFLVACLLLTAIEQIFNSENEMIIF